MKEITFEEFVRKYKPIKHSDSEYAAYDGYLFEDKNVFVETCFGIENNYIWTVISTEDEEAWCIPGYHFVNRIGWFICNKRWKDDTISVNLNDMISVGQAKYACMDFIEEELNIPIEDFENKLHDWWTNKF